MKKRISCIFIITFLTQAYLSTYLPPEPIPVKPEFDGYDEHTLGQQHMLEGRERKGLHYLEEAVQEGYIPAYRRLGDYYYYKMNQPERAKDYYLVGIDQGDILALESLANIYLKENNYQKAVEYYEKLAVKKPTVWLIVNRIYNQLNNSEKADEALKKYQDFHEYYYWHR